MMKYISRFCCVNYQNNFFDYTVLKIHVINNYLGWLSDMVDKSNFCVVAAANYALVNELFDFWVVC